MVNEAPLTDFTNTNGFAYTVLVFNPEVNLALFLRPRQQHRGGMKEYPAQYVVARITPETLHSYKGEWAYGAYFEDLESALRNFRARRLKPFGRERFGH